MKKSPVFWPTLFAVMLVAALAAPGHAQAQSSPTTAETIEKFFSAWQGIETYQCTLTSHEVDGIRVQDRVYHMFFEKPMKTRMEIISGDGRGGAAVWSGGDTLRGHRGGMLAGIKKTLDIHSPLATSIRGTTIADANYGILLGHIRTFKPDNLDAARIGDRTLVTAQVADPASQAGVTKEVFIFGADGLPLEFEQYQGASMVKKVDYSDVKLNVPLPDSLFHI
ncbi:MAG: LolA family protein [Candidatus Eremiobacter antarcticus]|nr:hypothetical protein [Candidatus Eremiobacteraeota bacterium]MBC5807148.1 hypothetical protein [Candidatus Eremiobacteraeota bacterium]